MAVIERYAKGMRSWRFDPTSATIRAGNS